MCQHVEVGGNLQLIKGLLDKLLPTTVKGFSGAGLHPGAPEHLPRSGTDLEATGIMDKRDGFGEQWDEGSCAEELFCLLP